MSTISSSFIPDPLSSLASQRHRWLQRRRKHYMETTNKCSAQLCELLDSETKQSLKQLASSPLDVSIPSSLLPLRGLTIKRSAFLFEVKPGQRVSLVDLAERVEVSSGFVVAVSVSSVKIKLSKTIEPRALPSKAEEAGQEGKEEPASEQTTDGSGELASEETTVAEEDEAQLERDASVPAAIAAASSAIDADDQEEIVVIGSDDPDENGQLKDETDSVQQQQQFDTRPLECRIKFDWSHVLSRHECISNAICRFRRVACSVPLHKCLLGIFNEHNDVIREKWRLVNFDELPEPRDKMQLLAIGQTMRKRVALVEGPAGSGKTTMAAHIACNMSRLRRQKVLICSPVQKTIAKLGALLAPVAGLLAVELPDLGSFRVPRSSSRCQTQMGANLPGVGPGARSSCRLDKRVDEAIYSMACRRSRDYFEGHTTRFSSSQNNCCLERDAIEAAKRKAIHAHASRVVASSLPWLRRKFEQKLLRKANIVICNLLQAGSWQLEGIEFDLLIIDDAQWASELECLVPIVTRSVKQVTLLSDLRRDIRLPEGQRGQFKLYTNNTNQANNQAYVSHVNSNSNSNNNNNNNNININYNTYNPANFHHKISGKSLNGMKRSYSTGNANIKNYALESELNYEFLGPTNEPGGLFERWLSLGLSAVALRVQFRAHKSLSTFTSSLFYCQPPKDDARTNRELSKLCRSFKRATDSFDWLPDKRCLTALFDERAFGGSLEETLTRVLLNMVQIEQIDRSRIGVIFNKLAFDLSSIDKSAIAGIETGTIVDFIGDEKDFFLVVGRQVEPENDSDTKREQSNSRIDFLRSDNALNVALTRARLGMLIIADLNKQAPSLNIPSLAAGANSDGNQPGPTETSTLCKSWRDMVVYYEANELIKR